ncbi:MAG: hypothetical protein QM820_65240 [Minicystis sp.]
MRARSSRAISGAAGLAVLLMAGAALAEPTAAQRAAAAALFEDGKKLMADNKLDEACPKLAESQRLDPGMGTLFNLAVCYEKTNRTASAWVGYRDVAALAMAAGQGEREKVARDRAAALEPKLMRLKITVQPAAASAGVEVKRDGEVIASALWGTGVPVDPGKHVVTASAPGKAPWEVTATLDQPGKTVTIDVPALADQPGAAAGKPPVAPPPGPAMPPPVLPPPPVETTSSPRPWQMPLGIAATAVGAVGLGVGVGFGVLAKSAFNDFEHERQLQRRHQPLQPDRPGPAIERGAEGQHRHGPVRRRRRSGGGRHRPVGHGTVGEERAAAWSVGEAGGRRRPRERRGARRVLRRRRPRNRAR